MIFGMAVVANWTGKCIVWYIVWPLLEEIGTCTGMVCCMGNWTTWGSDGRTATLWPFDNWTVCRFCRLAGKTPGPRSIWPGLKICWGCWPPAIRNKRCVIGKVSAFFTMLILWTINSKRGTPSWYVEKCLTFLSHSNLKLQDLYFAQLVYMLKVHTYSINV